MYKAVIIAGGKGERLRPLTEDKPKPMVPVLGQPIIAHTLRLLKAYGYREVVICCGYKNEVLREFIGNGSKFQLSVDYIVEETPLGRGGAIKAGLKKLGELDSPVLALNGDLMTNLNLGEFRDFHNKSTALATLVSVPLTSPYGIVDVEENGQVNGFREKPQLPFWINAGIYMLEPALIEQLPDVGDHEVETFPRLAQEGKLRAFTTRSFWRTVDTIKDLTEVRNEVEQAVWNAFIQTNALSLPV